MKYTGVLATLVLLFSLFTGYAHAEEPGTININQADITALTTLTGIGDAKAEAIVAYRTEHGPFQTVEDLAKVTGIGPRTIERNADRLSTN